jgi:hypothetical protein
MPTRAAEAPRTIASSMSIPHTRPLVPEAISSVIRPVPHPASRTERLPRSPAFL